MSTLGHPYCYSYDPISYEPMDNLEQSFEDSSEDDCSMFINNTFSFNSTSVDSRYDDQIIQSEGVIKKKKELVSWLRKFGRKSSTHKLCVCGLNSINQVVKWLEDEEVCYELVNFNDFFAVSINEILERKSLIVVQAPRIQDVANNLYRIEACATHKIIFCVNETKNCPRNYGNSFSKTFKRITLK
ncbi:Uncharacterized protein QTN25_001765 [Entamoeba marina]